MTAETPLPDELDAPSTFAHWKRNIAFFLGGQAISLFGSMTVQFAIMWHLTLQTQSATIITLYAVIGFLPQALISLFGGTLADRIDRRMLVIIPDAVIALATFILALIMASGYESLPIIFFVVFIRSVGAGFQSPAVAAMMTQIVPEKEFVRLNGLNSSLQSMIGILAPVTGGAIYGLSGIQATLYVDVVTAILAIVILLFLPVTTTPPQREVNTFFTDLIDGLRYTMHRKTLAWIMAIYITIILLVVGPNYLVPLLVTQRFGGEVWELTLTEVTFQVGVVIGGIAISTILAKRSGMHYFIYSSLGFALLAMALPLSPALWVVFTLNFITGFLVPIFVSPSVAVLQKTVDEEYMGRIMSQVNLVFPLGVPMSMAVLGPLAAVAGIAQVLFAAGTLTLIIVLVLVYATAAGKEVRAQIHRELSERRGSS